MQEGVEVSDSEIQTIDMCIFSFLREIAEKDVEDAGRSKFD